MWYLFNLDGSVRVRFSPLSPVMNNTLNHCKVFHSVSVPRNIIKKEEQSQENDCLDAGRTENEPECEEETQTVKAKIQVKEENRSDETTVMENIQIKEEKLTEVETQTQLFVKKEVPGSIDQEDEIVQPFRVKTEKDWTEVKIDEATESCKKMEKNETKKSPSIKCVTAQKSDVHQKNKSEQLPSERSQKRACSSEDVGQKLSPKRPRSASKDEQPVKIPKVDLKPKNDRADVKKGGINGLTEDLRRISTKFFTCCCVNREPVHLCGSCCRKIPKNDVISHLTESQHQKMDQLVRK